jgi:AcrR family transcriptional regulator
VQSTERDTYRKILETASRLFSEKGYANVSIRDVCRETGTTPPMIYYYFGSKKGLFDAVVRERITMKDFIEKLRKDSLKDDSMDALLSFVDTYLRFFPENVFDIGLYIRDRAQLDEKSASILYKNLETISTILSSIIERCINQGVLRKTDPKIAAECLLGMLNHPIFQRLHFSKESDIERYKKCLIDIFLHGTSKAR